MFCNSLGYGHPTIIRIFGRIIVFILNLKKVAMPLFFSNHKDITHRFITAPRKTPLTKMIIHSGCQEVTPHRPFDYAQGVFERSERNVRVYYCL